MMARVGSCDASPPPLPSGRAAAYATASSTLPSPGIWTVHGSTLSPSYAVSTVGYDGPAVIALSDTRSMTASRVPHSPAQHAYYEITVDPPQHSSGTVQRCLFPVLSSLSHPRRRVLLVACSAMYKREDSARYIGLESVQMVLHSCSQQGGT
ncbi:hypothetical protein MRX96_017935 [Rhipicephalus microplus]